MQPSVETKTIIAPGPIAGQRVCLFVSYSPDGSLKRHVAYHLEAIKACGFKPILILVVDRIVNRSWKRLVPADQSLLVRANAGFDFGAWADAFRLMPDLWRAQCVLLVNDSVFGPVGSLQPVMANALADPADVVGLTQSFETRPHLQSYFLLVKSRALANPAVRQFWAGVRNLDAKQAVIDAYEVPFYGRCIASGLTAKALFDLPQFRDRSKNPVLDFGHELLRHGFPYIKVSLFGTGIDRNAWRVLRPAIANDALAEAIDAHISRTFPEHAPEGATAAG